MKQLLKFLASEDGRKIYFSQKLKSSVFLKTWACLKGIDNAKGILFNLQSDCGITFRPYHFMKTILKHEGRDFYFGK